MLTNGIKVVRFKTDENDLIKFPIKTNYRVTSDDIESQKLLVSHYLKVFKRYQQDGSSKYRIDMYNYEEDDEVNGYSHFRGIVTGFRRNYIDRQCFLSAKSKVYPHLVSGISISSPQILNDKGMWETFDNHVWLFFNRINMDKLIETRKSMNCLKICLGNILYFDSHVSNYIGRGSGNVKKGPDSWWPKDCYLEYKFKTNYEKDRTPSKITNKTTPLMSVGRDSRLIITDYDVIVDSLREMNVLARSYDTNYRLNGDLIESFKGIM